MKWSKLKRLNWTLTKLTGYNLYFGLIIKIWVGIPRQTFLILKKIINHVSIFHPTLNGKYHFDTRLKGWGLIRHSWKIRDQFDTKAKGWGLKRYLNLNKIAYDQPQTCIINKINQVWIYNLIWCWPRLMFKIIRSNLELLILDSIRLV